MQRLRRHFVDMHEFQNINKNKKSSKRKNQHELGRWDWLDGRIEGPLIFSDVKFYQFFFYIILQAMTKDRQKAPKAETPKSQDIKVPEVRGGWSDDVKKSAK